MDIPSFSIGEEFEGSVGENLGGQKKKQGETAKGQKKKQPRRKALQSLDGNSLEKPERIEKHVNEEEIPEALPLPIDFLDSDSDFENEELGKSKKRGFLEIDEQMCLKFDKKASTKRKDEAYAQRYYEWRNRYGARFGASTCQKRIQEFNLTEMREFGQHLVFFIQQIVQKNGKPYRATTIKDFLTTFGRLLREGRRTRIRETAMDEPDINIFEHPFFAAAKEAANHVIAKIVAAQPRKQRLNLINDVAVMKLLSAEEFSLSTPNGLLNRVMLYCMVNFLIRGGRELYETKFVEFELLEDHYGRFLRFMQKPSKNHPGNINNCKESDMRKPVEVYEHINADVYMTFTKYLSCLPPIAPHEDISERHLLLAAKTSIAGGNAIWYASCNLGINKVTAVGKHMSNILGFRVSNVCLRHYAITKGRLQGIPDDNLKDLTGHKRVETLRNYDHSDKQLMMAMQASLKVGGESYTSAISSLRQNMREPDKNVEVPTTISRKVLALGEREVWNSPFEEIEDATGLSIAVGKAKEVPKVIEPIAKEANFQISEAQHRFSVGQVGMQQSDCQQNCPEQAKFVGQSLPADCGCPSLQNPTYQLNPTHQQNSIQNRTCQQNPTNQFGAPVKGFTFTFSFN